MSSLLRLAAKLDMTERKAAVSLGQGQGPKAEAAITEGKEQGMWVILQNCHLSVSWMPKLEATVEELDPEKKDAAEDIMKRLNLAKQNMLRSAPTGSNETPSAGETPMASPAAPGTGFCGASTMPGDPRSRSSSYFGMGPEFSGRRSDTIPEEREVEEEGAFMRSLGGPAATAAAAAAAANAAMPKKVAIKAPPPGLDCQAQEAKFQATTLSDALPSVGSASHADGTCRRCSFFPKKNCSSGYNCEFCHFMHKRRNRIRPCKGKRERFRKLVDRVEKIINDETPGPVDPSLQ